jgi:L-ascorbate metabolism protein UlaG (beta-lactamase superfamily)
MKYLLYFLSALFCAGHFGSYGSVREPQHNPNMEQVQHHDDVLKLAGTIQWLGQATVRINYKEHIIYIDPYQLTSSVTADIILITHDHGDHLSLTDIAKIAGPDTRFVVAEACVDKLKQAGYTNIESVAPGSKINVLGLGITAVPAYNLSKQMHPKARNYVGYIIDFNGISVYHTGDTERVPEMKDIRCDIILLPLGQTYTMNSVEDAVEVVLDTKASVAIPIHWGLYEGSVDDARRFTELLKQKNVTVLSGK